MLVLSADDVSSVLTMSECIGAMAEALSGFANETYWQPPRTKIHHEGAASMLGLMPAYRSGVKPTWGFKHIVVAPENRVRGIDSHQGAVLLNDGETGRPIGLVDATSITAIRTAAVSALATKALARADAALVAIVGTGVQARMHVDAMRTIFPHVRILVGARTQRAGEEFAERMGVETADCIRDAVSGADVVCTVTSSREPVLAREWIKPGCHLNAVGTSDPSSREIDGILIGASEFFIDSRAQAEKECGEYLLAIAEGTIEPDHLLAELGEVLVGRHPGRSSSDAITLFKSLGLAVEDLAAAELALCRAREQGRGVEVPW